MPHVNHAVGSFLDHLQFCFEYGSVHYKQHSPRVLYLHSIMGVGTNLFPMPLSKVRSSPPARSASKLRLAVALASSQSLLLALSGGQPDHSHAYDGCSKVGKLRALISEFEMTHVEAFPSILRLLNHQKAHARSRARTHAQHQHHPWHACPPPTSPQRLCDSHSGRAAGHTCARICTFCTHCSAHGHIRP